MKPYRDINPTMQHIDDYVPLENGMIAHRYNILGTTIVCYVVYESSRPFGMHSSITHHRQYGWLGDIVTRPLPKDLDALTPRSLERATKVRAYYAAQELETERLIRQAFPDDFLSHRKSL